MIDWFDILVTRIVPSVLTARSRQFYWRNTKAPRLLAASHPRPPTIMFRAGPAALGLETWEEATEAEEGIIWNTFIMRYDKKCCLGHTYVCFGFVNWKKYNYTTMLKKTVAKNELQKKNLISFEDQWSILKSFHLLLAIWMALGIGQSLLFPLFQLQDVKLGLFRLNHFPFHKFEAVPTCCPEGVLFPPRNLLIIRDICMFHAQLHQKNSTCCISWPFIFP